MALIYTGGQVAAEGPQSFAVAAVVTGSYGHSVTATITDGQSYGIAGSFNAHIAGTPSGINYGVSIGLNMDDGAVMAGQMVSCLDLSLSEATAASGANTLYMISMGSYLTTPVNSLYALFRFNMAAGGTAPDVFFAATDGPIIAYQQDANEGATKAGAIKVKINGENLLDTFGYIRIYQEAN